MSITELYLIVAVFVLAGCVSLLSRQIKSLIELLIARGHRLDIHQNEILILAQAIWPEHKNHFEEFMVFGEENKDGKCKDS